MPVKNSINCCRDVKENLRENENKTLMRRKSRGIWLVNNSDSFAELGKNYVSKTQIYKQPWPSLKGTSYYTTQIATNNQIGNGLDYKLNQTCKPLWSPSITTLKSVSYKIAIDLNQFLHTCRSSSLSLDLLTSLEAFLYDGFELANSSWSLQFMDKSRMICSKLKHNKIILDQNLWCSYASDFFWSKN